MSSVVRVVKVVVKRTHSLYYCSKCSISSMSRVVRVVKAPAPKSQGGKGALVIVGPSGSICISSTGNMSSSSSSKGTCTHKSRQASDTLAS